MEMFKFIGDKGGDVNLPYFEQVLNVDQKAVAIQHKFFTLENIYNQLLSLLQKQIGIGSAFYLNVYRFG